LAKLFWVIIFAVIGKASVGAVKVTIYGLAQPSKRMPICPFKKTQNGHVPQMNQSGNLKTPMMHPFTDKYFIETPDLHPNFQTNKA